MISNHLVAGGKAREDTSKIFFQDGGVVLERILVLKEILMVRTFNFCLLMTVGYNPVFQGRKVVEILIL